MAKLYEIALAIKSQNAGATHYAFDIMFKDEATYRKVCRAGVVTREVVSRLYKTPVEKVQLYHFDPARSIVVAIPRPTLNGNPDDTDVDGSQQHVPLMFIDVP